MFVRNHKKYSSKNTHLYRRHEKTEIKNQLRKDLKFFSNRRQNPLLSRNPNNSRIVLKARAGNSPTKHVQQPANPGQKDNTERTAS